MRKLILTAVVALVAACDPGSSGPVDKEASNASALDVESGLGASETQEEAEKPMFKRTYEEAEPELARMFDEHARGRERITYANTPVWHCPEGKQCLYEYCVPDCFVAVQLFHYVRAAERSGSEVVWAEVVLAMAMRGEFITMPWFNSDQSVEEGLASREDMMDELDLMSVVSPIQPRDGYPPIFDEKPESYAEMCSSVSEPYLRVQTIYRATGSSESDKEEGLRLMREAVPRAAVRMLLECLQPVGGDTE